MLAPLQKLLTFDNNENLETFTKPPTPGLSYGNEPEKFLPYF